MNGIINVYKEKGFTSHDVVAKLRRICHMKKIGHTGTLDPDAEGVLPVCLGTATKVCSLLTDMDKTYRAVLLLGQSTDTQDCSGKILYEKEVCCTKEEAGDCIQSFVGEIAQIPPMYSARKINGKKLYELAREGIEVERKPRKVQIYRMEIEEIALPRISLTIHCSKGTYIRTLCNDIGEKLGCGGCMEYLERIRVGDFHKSSARTLGEIEELAARGQLEEHLIPVDQLFGQYPCIWIKDGYDKLLENGNRLPACAVEQVEPNSGRVRLYRTGKDGGTDEFFGIYSYDSKKRDYRPVQIFWQRNEYK